MVPRSGWDLKSTHSLEAHAEWIRSNTDALIVLIIRPQDAVLSVDDLIDVIDVHDRIWEKDFPRLLESLVRIRDEKRAKQLKREAKRNGH